MQGLIEVSGSRAFTFQGLVVLKVRVCCGGAYSRGLGFRVWGYTILL